MIDFLKKLDADAFIFILLSLSNVVLIELPGIAPVTVFLAFAPIYILWKFFNLGLKGIRFDDGYLLVLPIYLLLSSILNFESSRVTSILYSIFYFAFYILISQKLRYKTSEYIYSLAKAIILIQLFGTLMAQLFAITQVGYLAYFENFLYRDIVSGQMRFMGFSTEPSYAAFIVLSAYFVCLLNQVGRKSFDFVLFAIVVYLVAVFSSIYGYIVFLTIIGWLVFLLLKSPKYKILGLAIILLLIISTIFIFSFSENERVESLVDAIRGGYLTIDSLREIDSSAWMRVGPTFLYLDSLDLLNLHTYIGYGAASSTQFFTDMLSEHIDTKSITASRGFALEVGFLPAFLYDFGIVGFTLCLTLLFRQFVVNFVFIGTTILLLMLLNANFNTQLFWFVSLMVALAGRVVGQQNFTTRQSPRLTS